MTNHTPHLSTSAVTRRFGALAALDDISFDVERGQVVCLVGHSGCGKSTLLRAIAGVEQIDGGTITIAGRLVCGPGTFIEPEKRNVGLMFQDYALFPHLTARQNIAFGLTKLSRTACRTRVDETIARLGIGSLAERYPHMLSGGEQQRVALARALAPQPEILLMDEPFSNLDRSLRDTIRNETLSLVRASGITAIVVTHDPEEALALGDLVVLMDRGRIVEAGTGEALYRAPKTPYAASFFSRVNRIPALRSGNHVESVLGSFPAHFGDHETAEVFIRPHSLRLDVEGVPAEVRARSVLGEIEELTLAVAGLEAPLVMRSSTRQNVAVGDSVRVLAEPGEVMVFPRTAPHEAPLDKPV